MPERSEIKIGVTWSDTGWCWLDSRFLYTGLQVWAAETNANGGMWAPDVGRHLPVRLIQADDRSHPEVGLWEITRMIEEDSVDVVCSSGSSEIQAEVVKVTEAAGMVNLNVGAPDSRLFEGTRFHLQCGPSLEGYYLSRPPFWRAHGLQRLAVLGADFAGWNAVTEGLPEAMAAEGLDIVLWELVPRYQRWSTQYGPYPADFDGWTSVVDSLVDCSADAVVIALPAPAQLRLMQEIRRRGAWWRYLEMMYSLALTRIGFGPAELLLQFSGGYEQVTVPDADITVGGTQAALDAKAPLFMPGVSTPVSGRSYLAPALWGHLVAKAGSLDGKAVMAQAHHESGQIVTMLGRLVWQESGDTQPSRSGGGSVLQIQRHPWSAEMRTVPVWPPTSAAADPQWSIEPYERRPPPWLEP
jgi:hypothetical protein